MIIIINKNIERFKKMFWRYVFFTSFDTFCKDCLRNKSGSKTPLILFTSALAFQQKKMLSIDSFSFIWLWNLFSLLLCIINVYNSCLFQLNLCAGCQLVLLIWETSIILYSIYIYEYTVLKHILLLFCIL